MANIDFFVKNCNFMESADELQVSISCQIFNMDPYLLIRYFRCTVSHEEELAVQQWLADDADGSRAKEFNDAHLLYIGMVMHGDEAVDAGRPDSRPAVPAGRGGRPFTRSPLRKILAAVSVAAAVAFVAVVSSLVSYHVAGDRLSGQFQTVRVPAGKSMELVLSDGTSMWLNAGTEIEYPAVFSGKDRTVRLISGEAMFDVARDGKRPFNVETFASVITVLGTKFNVTVDSGAGRFSAALLRGSVKVKSLLPEDDSEYLLKPNEMISTDGESFTMSRIKDPGSVECWTRGLVDVAGVPFDELMRKFELLFDVDIIIEREQMPAIRYTWGKIRVSEGLDHALGVLSKASDFSWERNFETGTVIIR